jgi:hypothetical protein
MPNKTNLAPPLPNGDASMYVLLGQGARSAWGRNHSATLESWAANHQLLPRC